MIRAASRAAVLAAIWLCAAGAFAQQPPLDAPQPDRSVRDPEFGVIARHLGLERRVEMLQWQAVAGGYTRTWSTGTIDSAGFAPGHDNPGTIPLRSRRWVAKSVSIAGKPVDPDVIRAFAQWQDFRPSFAALPSNMSATFQPEGDGLGSAENPLTPTIGDLRIRWRDLVLPMLDGKIELRDGRWQRVMAAAAPVQLPTGSTRAATPDPGGVHPWAWVIGVAVVLLLAGTLGAWARRR